VLFGVRVIEYIFGAFPQWGNKLIEKLGSVVAFLSSMFPFPDITTMVLGAYKMPVLNFLIFSALGAVFRSWLVLAGAYKVLEYVGYNASDIVGDLQKYIKI